jgi:subtilase family serine protease
LTATVSGAAEAGPVNGEFTISRTGATDEALTVQLSTGGTATPGEDYAPLPEAATIDAGQASVAIPLVPVDDLKVEPDETVILAILPDPGYLLGSSGATATIASDDLPSDLVVTAVDGPSNGGAGEPITITDTTKNQGQGPSEPSVTGFYLSSDYRLSAGDVSLGTRDVPSLAVGEVSPAATTVTIPPDVATGTYYLLAAADASGVLAESSETNNVRFTSIRIGPDLIVTSVAVPPTGAAGGTISVTDTTKNAGVGTAGESVTAFYLSTNISLGEGDAFLGTRSVPLLASGEVSSVSTPLTVPADTPAGLYRVIAVADSEHAVEETSEANNTKYSSGRVTIGADLVVTAVVAPATAGAGNSIAVTDTVKNQGAGDAPDSTAALYLSTNVQLDGADVLLGSHAVPALEAGTSSSTESTVVIPPGTTTGTYYILGVADSSGQVDEAVETNNVKYSSIVRIGPNLVVSAVSAAPNKVQAGQTSVVTDTVKNVGAGSAGGSSTTLYFSTNLSIDASDIVVGTRVVPPLDPGTTSTGTTTIVVPAGTPAGYYRVIAKADGDQTVAETSETDNTRVAVLQVLAP